MGLLRRIIKRLLVGPTHNHEEGATPPFPCAGCAQERGEDPWECKGCHTGEMFEFDHFCDVLGVTDEEVPHAFAAWMGGRHGWNGEYRRI